MKKNDDKKIGDINIHHSKVNVHIGDGLEVCSTFETTGDTNIYIDSSEQWGIILGDFIHEALETKMYKCGCRFKRTDLPDKYEAVDCIFVADHEQFQVACHEVGIALSRILDKLEKYKKQ